MNETTNTNHCERAVELVAYFYNEATPAERESFDAHLARCGACRDELGAFAGVREAVGHWRAEILNAAPAHTSFGTAPAPETTTARSEQERAASRSTRSASSALAALRQFFTLSPVWLRAGTVAAALVVCALAALAVVKAEVRWDNGVGLAFGTRRDEAKTKQVAAPAAKVYTQAELDNLVAERDAALRELEDTRAQLDDSRAANLIAAVETLEPVPAESIEVPAPNPSRRERRTLSPTNKRQQQRLRRDRDEEDVPRLYDLLIEAN
jgi:Putative zinc-finger